MARDNWQPPDMRAMSEDENMSVGEEDNVDTEESVVSEEEEEGIILDPKHPQRYTWRDVRTKVEREVWRPGDGDGDRSTDYFGRVEPPKKIGDRWKLYQLSLGPIKHEHHEPPKYVFLDDRACYEVLQSNIPRASLGKFWAHDFGMSGKLRDRRPHRGRGSVGDPDAEGNNQFHFTQIGMKNAKYYFTGEKDFTPIIYRSEELQAEIAKQLEKKRKGWSIRNKKGDPKTRGHNQFTPKDRLVKNGGATASKSKKKRKRHDEHKVPEWLLDKPRQMGAPPAIEPAPSDSVNATNAPYGLEVDAGANKIRRLEGGGAGVNEVQSSSPSQMFPFHRQTVGHQAVPSGLYNPLAPIGNGYHQESTCPYTESRLYASQLEKDLSAAQDTISEQKGRIAELEATSQEKDDKIEALRRDLQDLQWSIGR